MTAFLLANVASIRLGVFAAVLLIMALWEVLAPRRQQKHGRAQRWPSNFGVLLVDALITRLLIPTTLAAFAATAAAQGWGLFNVLTVPHWVAIVLSILLLDLAIYGQHVTFHAVPMFWRLHRMHHADTECDVTTGIRFHPIEIVLSVLIKMTIIAALGAPAVAVLVFEILLNATSLFNHSNVAMPQWLDALVRRLIVTPDMHRVHHSVAVEETNSNYGFNLSLWDRVFGTYRPQPKAGQLGMTIGLDAFRDGDELRLDRMLTQPFRDDARINLDR